MKPSYYNEPQSNIDYITSLQYPSGGDRRGFSYPVFGRAKEYRDATTGALAVLGFSIDFDNEQEARDFLEVMKNLSYQDRPIFRNLKKQKESYKHDTTTNKHTINIEINWGTNYQDLERKIRSSNLAKLIERQKARKDRAGKSIIATAINAATFGVPVAGYALGYLGRGLAALERNGFGAIPGVGFALRTSARACLDSGAGILEHGASFLETSTTQDQARLLEVVSDDVGRKHDLGNGIFDSILFGAGVVFKAIGVPFNAAGDVINRAARVIDKRKADEDISTFRLRKAASKTLKALAFPFRVPEIVGNWLAKPAEESSSIIPPLAKAHANVSRAFGKLRFDEPKKEEPLATARPADVKLGEGAVKEKIYKDDLAKKILALKSGLVFDRELKGKYYAALAKFDIQGREYEVLACGDDGDIVYKYRGRVYKDLPQEHLRDVNRELAKVAEGLKEVGSKLSFNGFAACTTNEDFKKMLKEAIEKAKLNDENKEALKHFDVEASSKFSIKVGSKVLNYGMGGFEFSSHGESLDLKSREFFNFVSHLSQGKAEITTQTQSKYSPKYSPQKPRAINLVKVTRAQREGASTEDRSDSPRP